MGGVPEPIVQCQNCRRMKNISKNFLKRGVQHVPRQPPQPQYNFTKPHMKKETTTEVHYTTHLYKAKEKIFHRTSVHYQNLNFAQNSQKMAGLEPQRKHQTIIPERRCILEYQTSKYRKNLCDQRKYLEPNAGHCPSLKTLECFFPNPLLSVATL